jgi:hypothetical protein
MAFFKPGQDILPFIIEPGKTTPVSRFERPEGTKVMVFNLPTDVLQPTAYNLSAKLDKTSYDMYATLLGFFCTLHAFNYMAEVEEEEDTSLGATVDAATESDQQQTSQGNSKKSSEPHTGLLTYNDSAGNVLPKTEVFMEYVLRENVVVEQGATPNLSECTAIRFFFVVHKPLDFVKDSSDVFTTGTRKLIDYFAKKAKGVKTRSGKYNPSPFEFCSSVTTLERYAELCCEYMKVNSFKYSWKNMLTSTSPAQRLNCFCPARHVPDSSMESQLYEMGEGGEGPQEFAFPHLVFRIEHYLLPTVRLFGVTLPGTTEWAPQSGQDLEFTRTSLSNMEYMRSILSRSTPPVNGYRQITVSRELNEARIMGSPENQADPDRLARLLRMNNLQHACRCEAALSTGVTLGEDLEAYAKFAGTFTEFQKPLVKIFDHSLSFYGNYMATEWMVYENYYHLACNHRIAKVLELAALDSLRDAKELRPNILIPGNGETGKSFLLDKVRDKWVPGTCPEVTALTENSFITNEPTLFNIMLFHEVPELIMGISQGPGGPATGSGVIKDVLTRNEVSKKTCHVEDGQRLQINTSCEYEAVMLMATNEATSKMPEPIVSRMLILNIVDYKKDYGTRTEKAAPMDVRQRIALNKRVDAYHSRFRQGLIAQLYVEALIKFQVLADVDVSPCINLVDVTADYCRRYGMVDWGNRVNDSVRAMIRTNTIQYAIIRYLSMYGKPDGPVSMDNSFSTFAPRYNSAGEMVHRGIQPFLIATEEVALFVISCIFESFDGTVDYMVLEGILNALIMAHAKHRVSGETYEIKLGVSNGDMYEFDMGITFFHVLVESVHRYLAKHTRYKISNQQVQTSFDNLRKHNFVDVSTTTVKLNWVKAKEFFTVIDNKYRFNMDTRGHIEKILRQVTHRDFANGSRLLIASPVDINHQDILNEVTVPREGPYKRLVKETRVRIGEGSLEDDFGSLFGDIMAGPSGDVGGELLALRGIIPGATQADVGRLLYDNPNDTSNVPCARYPEAFLGHVYNQVKLTQYPQSKAARKRGLDLIDQYNNHVDKSTTEIDANPADHPSKRIRIDS